jgi:hypothetical protein
MSVVTQIQVRRGTAAQWTSTNPTLAAGEFGFETDTNKLKCGNGATAWNSLTYINNDGDITGVTAGTGLSGGGTSGSVTVSIDTSVTVDLTTAQTLTNKTLTTPVISSISNTGTLTLPTTTGTVALTSDIPSLTGYVTETGTQTLSNKTLTTPVISSISNTGTLTLPTSTDTLVGRATTDTLTNKTLTAPVISTITNTGTLTLPTTTGTVALTSDIPSLTGYVTETGTQTLTNKTLTDPKINLAFDAETGASYTAILANNGQVVTMSNGSGNTFRIPTNASVAFPIGTQINVLQIGAGQTTINAVTSGTTTIESTGAAAAAPKLRARYSAATCLKADTDLWYVFGDIA